MDENVEWEADEAKKGDPTYWAHRRYLELQVDGVYDGYMMANADKPDRVLLYCVLFSSRLSLNGKSSMQTMMGMLETGILFLITPR